MRVKEIRKELGLRQDQVAKMLGITQSYWSKIEKSDAYPTKLENKIKPFLELGQLIEKYKKSIEACLYFYSVCPFLRLPWSRLGKPTALMSMDSLSSFISCQLEDIKKAFLFDLKSVYKYKPDNIINKLAHFINIKNYIAYNRLIECRQYCACLQLSSSSVKYFRIEYHDNYLSFSLSGDFLEFISTYLACRFRHVDMNEGKIRAKDDCIIFNGTTIFFNPNPISSLLNNFISETELDLPFSVMFPF